MTKEKFDRATELERKIRVIGNVLAVWEREDNRCVYIGIAGHPKETYFDGEIAEDIMKKLEAWKKALEVEFEKAVRCKMDKKIIELAKASMAIAEICDNHTKCEDCPFCLPGAMLCTCKNKVALAMAEEHVEAEEAQPKADVEPQETEETTPAEKRKRILDDAIDAVCSDRCEMYGEPEDNFGVICKLWETYLNAAAMPKGVYIDLTEQCVADMMILFKVGRSATALEDHRDTYVDIAGYAACAGGMCEG